jgi:hypothetical protein
MRFDLPEEFRGNQLADEIRIATGIDVADRYGYYHLDHQIEIVGEDIEENALMIQIVIDAHVPDPFYFPSDFVNKHKSDVREQVLALLGGKTPGEILTWEQENIDAITDLAEAKAFLRSRIPIIEAVIAWALGYQDG